MSSKPIEDLDVSYVSVVAGLAKFTVMVLSLQANITTLTNQLRKGKYKSVISCFNA